MDMERQLLVALEPVRQAWEQQQKRVLSPRQQFAREQSYSPDQNTGYHLSLLLMCPIPATWLFCFQPAQTSPVMKSSATHSQQLLALYPFLLLKREVTRYRG
jgi:hypothetical protein